MLLDLRSLLESSGESNISGAVLEGSDSAAGTLALAITLSGAVLEGSDVVAGTLAAVHSISGAVTEGSDAVAGTLDLPIAISGSVEEGSDSSSGSLEVSDAAQVGLSGGFKERKKKKKEHEFFDILAESREARAERIRAEREALGLIVPEPAPESAPERVVDLGDEPEEYEAPAYRQEDIAIGRPLTPMEIEELRVLLRRAADEEDIEILMLALAAS